MEDRYQLARRETGKQPRAYGNHERQSQQGQAVRGDRLRRNTRRIDDPELRAAGVLDILAHRGRFTPREETVVRFLQHLVITRELRVLGLRLRNELRLSLQLTLLRLQ